MDEKEVRDIWGVEKDPQTPLGILIVTVAKGPKNNLPLDQDIEVVLNFAKTRYQNLLNNPPEFGTVNGHAFARVRFRAEGLRGVHGLESGEVFGFLYVTDDGQTPIVIQGAGRADVIELIEASAQTVRLTP